MSETAAIDILREHSLRVTPCRHDILRVFLSTEKALSQPDLELALGETYDRVTLYRTLTSFLEHGLIHRIPDDAGAARYALCNHDCEEGEHTDEHIHFKCLRCGNMSCLDELPFPHFKAPEGFSFSETHVLIQGLCRECSAAA